MAEFKFPTEEVELPSKGLVYPEDNPLSSGKVEIKYMTAKEEDILSNQSYIQKGTVLDKLLESVVVSSDVKIKDLIIGDKNALLIATRILGYGKEYKFNYGKELRTVDLTEIENKEFDTNLINKGENSFPFELPHSGNNITFRILTGHEESKIEKELAGLKKINKEPSELTTRLKYIITSVGGDNDSKTIREFVDNYLLARDSRSLREYIRQVQPDVNLNYQFEDGEEVVIPIGIGFFWPDF